jgi:hypothetical protein
MSEPRKPAADAAASGDRHGRDLQKVNEKLRELVASLRTERERHTADGRAQAPAPTPAPVGPAAADLAHDPVDLEKKRLAAELALAHEAVAHANEERERLRARLAELEVENQRMCDDYVAVQEKSTDLAQLYVALERIHGGLSRADTLAALQEIVINVIGSEELAIFERRGDRLALVQSFGIDPAPWREPAAPRGALARAAQGKLYVAGRDGPPEPGDEDLTACVPLRVGDGVAGVIAIFRLLGHKPVLGDADHAIFDLLTSHAGVALHLRAPERARPA